MSFFVRSAPERRSWIPEPVIPPVYGGSTRAGGGGPTIDTALQQSAVWACVRLIADVVSMMPCHAYTYDKTDPAIRRPVEDGPLLKNPSADATFPEWVYMLLVSAMLRGNAVGRVVRRDTATLYPVQIEWYGPDKVHGSVRDGLPVYTVDGKEVPRQDIFHFRAYRMGGNPWGLSPIKYAALAINREAAIQAFSYGYFTDAPHPQSVLESDQPITADEAESTKKRLLARMRGREPLVLGAGLKYRPLSVSPEESQFLATQKLGVAEIARIYGVPPEMIAAEAGNSLTYANVEQRGIDFLTYSIQPWLTKLEAALSQLLPGRQHVRFDPSVLLRTDLETRMKATALGIASKQLTPDEARELGDYAPLTEAQKKVLMMIPLTVSVSGRAGKEGADGPIVDLAPGDSTPTEGVPA